MNKKNNIVFFEIPSHCPVCGGNTEIKKDNSTEFLICTNPNCKGKLLSRLTHFVSKNAMNIDGLSESTLEKLIENDFVNKFIDIYTLKKEDILSLQGFGKKSADNLINAIENSKHTTLDRFIYALSIPLIGRSASKTIGNAFNGDYQLFYEALQSGYDWEQLEDFGMIMSESIYEYANAENLSMISELAAYMDFSIQDNIQKTNNLSGLTFCITGSLNTFENRDVAKEVIENAGGKVVGSVSAKLNYLINNDIESTSGKNKKAKELGVQIISEEDFLKLLNESI